MFQISFFQHKAAPQATVQTFDNHNEFFATLQSEARPDKDGPLWSASIFENNYRTQRAVVNGSPHVIGLDFDGPREKGEATGESAENMEAVLTWLWENEILAAAHHTYSSYVLPTSRQKWRIIVALDRGVSFDEYVTLWSRIATEMPAAPDKTCNTPDRAFYLPSHPVGVEPFGIRVIRGAPLVVDTWLKKRPVAGVPSSFDLNTVKVRREPKTEDGWLKTLHTAEIKNEALNRAAFAVAKMRTMAGTGTDGLDEVCLYHLEKNPSPMRDREHARGIARRSIDDGREAARKEIEADAAAKAATKAATTRAVESGLRFVTNLEGAPVWCTENLNKLFRGHPDLRGKLRLNRLRDSHEIAEKVPFADKGEITDKVKTLALEWATETFPTYGAAVGKTFNSTDLALGALLAACEPYDPVQDYFAGLPEWDGVPRLATWLVKYGHAVDTAYVREIGLRWILQIVARTFGPGCEAPGVLMLVGPQGAGKSSIPLALMGHIRGAVTDTLPPFGDKDVHVQLAHCAIAELSELFTFKKAENEAIKSVITTRSARVRASYARVATEFLRRGVLVGTTNDARFLTDDTGNRRAWSVAVSDVDLAGLSADRDGIWAEALAVWRAEGLGCQLIHPSMYAAQAEAQAAFMIEDDGEEVFRDVIACKDKERFPAKGGSSFQLADEQLGPDGVMWLTVSQAHTLCGLNILNPGDQRKLGKWVKACKWEKYFKKLNGRTTKIFRKMEE